MSRLISLSSTSKILCIGPSHRGLQRQIGDCRDERRGSECILLPPPRAQRHPDGEPAAFPEFAFNENLAAHQLDEFLTQRQSQSGAAILARARVVDDGEFLEKT